MSTFPTENTAEAAYIMFLHKKETGELLPCQVQDNGPDEPFTITLGNGKPNKIGEYAMDYPTSEFFECMAHYKWLKMKIKNMRSNK
jgi:hypothetical protein